MDVDRTSTKVIFGLLNAVFITVDLIQISTKVQEFPNCEEGGKDFPAWLCHLYLIIFLVPDLIWILAGILGILAVVISVERRNAALVSTLVFQILGLVSILITSFTVWLTPMILTITLIVVMDILSISNIVILSIMLCCSAK